MCFFARDSLIVIYIPTSCSARNLGSQPCGSDWLGSDTVSRHDDSFFSIFFNAKLFSHNLQKLYVYSLLAIVWHKQLWPHSTLANEAFRVGFHDVDLLLVVCTKRTKFKLCVSSFPDVIQGVGKVWSNMLP